MISRGAMSTSREPGWSTAKATGFGVRLLLSLAQKLSLAD